MSLPTLFTVLCLLIPTILARPSSIYLLPRDTISAAPSTAYTTSTTTISDTVNVYICEHINWGGKCVNVLYNIGSGDCMSLDGTASSIRPDKGFSCTFYKNGSCRTFDGSESIKLQDPGSSDLTKEAGDWNDAARGFQCFRV